MKNVRFVGVHTVIGDREFTDFGASAEFSEAQFAEISRTAAFIPEQQFAELEISEDDLKKYGSVHYYGARPAAFLGKMEAGRALYREMRAGMQD